MKAVPVVIHFYKVVEKRANALASGAENIGISIRGFAGGDITQRESVAKNWKKIICAENFEVRGERNARMMINRAIKILEMPELHKLRLQQVTMESYRFYPQLKAIVQPN